MTAPVFSANQERFYKRLVRIYDEKIARVWAPRLEELAQSYSGRIKVQRSGWNERDALLITYGDSIQGDRPPLQELAGFLRKHVGSSLTYIHLLPFYPYTSDDGFSVVDYRQVRPDLGTWEDLEKLSSNYRLVYDGVINHVSASSEYVQGDLCGDAAYREFCISLPPETDTSSVLRTRNLPLLHQYPAHDGPRWLWTTFSQDQVDLNFANPKVLLEIVDVLLFYAEQGVSMIRLDAIPYLWKKLGTSCAHLPETHEIIKLLRDILDEVAPHVALLTETNVPHHENTVYFGDQGNEAQMIYNFSLAPLIVWSFFKGDASVLTEWAKQIRWISPRATYLNITATHDGIGMRPTEGILSESQRQELVQMAHDRDGSVTGKKNADGSVSPYELNISYFDAINDPRNPRNMRVEVERFIASQAIPMVMMGLPGIYIHSLLGSRNDLAGVKESGRARSINRETLSVVGLNQEIESPHHLRHVVFKKMKALLQIRSEEPAFHPDASQEILSLHPSVFALRRFNREVRCGVLALFNTASSPIEIQLPPREANVVLRDLVSKREFTPQSSILLEPHQFVWLKTLGD